MKSDDVVAFVRANSDRRLAVGSKADSLDSKADSLGQEDRKMDLRKTIDAEREAMDKMRKTLNIDTFGEIMDEFIRKSAVGLLVCKEENEEDFTVQGAGCGAVIDFYIMINALQPIFLQMLREMKGKIDPELLATSLCDVMRDSLVKAAEEEAAEDPDGAAEEEANRNV